MATDSLVNKLIHCASDHRLYVVYTYHRRDSAPTLRQELKVALFLLTSHPLIPRPHQPKKTVMPSYRASQPLEGF
jgi:hypothetical protein